MNDKDDHAARRRLLRFTAAFLITISMVLAIVHYRRLNRSAELLSIVRNASIQVVFLILITTLVADAVKSDDISRIESFKRLSQVKTGMSMATVEHIMGPLVKNILEEPGRDREWRFGSDPESRLGTLGTIVFDSNGNVRRISGVACEPMLLGLPPEDQLRRHLCGIDSLDGNDGNRFDSFELISIANQIYPLGQTAAYGVFREYLRISDDLLKAEANVYLLIQCLRDSQNTDESLVSFMIGEPFPKAPVDRRVAHSFPIVFLSDLPLMPVAGYSVIGERKPMREKLAEFKDRFGWRSNLLPIPDSSEAELVQDLLEMKASSEKWYFGQNESNFAEKLLRGQIARFVRSRDDNAAR